MVPFDEHLNHKQLLLLQCLLVMQCCSAASAAVLLMLQYCNALSAAVLQCCSVPPVSGNLTLASEAICSPHSCPQSLSTPPKSLCVPDHYWKTCLLSPLLQQILGLDRVMLNHGAYRLRTNKHCTCRFII
jgi:hypothetical protein